MKNKIAICRFVPFDLNLKGYNVQEVGMAKAFCEKGFDVDLIVLKSSNQKSYKIYENEGHCVICYEFPRYRIFRWGVNFSLLKKEFWEPYKFIVCFEYMEIMCYQVARLTKKVILYSGPYYNLFTIKPISLLYDKIVTNIYNESLVGNFTKSVLAQRFMEDKGYKNVNTLGVGLDIDKFENSSFIQPETQNLLAIMKKNKCLLYVGALSDRKNFSFLLDIFKNVRNLQPSVKLILIGKPCVSGFSKILGLSSKKYFDKHFNKLSASEKADVVHIDKIDNDQLRYIYPLASAFLLPSKQEIFGMVLLEALYFGAPVVSSRNGGSMTLIDGRNTGVMIEQFNVKEWCEAVLKLIQDDKYREIHVKNGKDLVTNEYNWGNITKSMLSYIE